MKKSDKKAARALQSRTFKRVLLYIKPYGLFVFSSLLCAAISVAAQLIVPIFCGDAIDYMIGQGQVDFASVLRLPLPLRPSSQFLPSPNGFSPHATTASPSAYPGICGTPLSGRYKSSLSPIWILIPPVIWSAASSRM